MNSVLFHTVFKIPEIGHANLTLIVQLINKINMKTTTECFLQHNHININYIVCLLFRTTGIQK